MWRGHMWRDEPRPREGNATLIRQLMYGTLFLFVFEFDACVLRPPWHNPLDAPSPPVAARHGTAQGGTGRLHPPPQAVPPRTLPKIGP